MTFDEKNRGKKVIFSLKKGANSYQSSYLPSCFMKNADSAHIHGHILTDTIASWVAKDFVCGPFESPPFKDFRVNSLLAIEQPSKIRPVLNISLPKNESFNDNIKKYLLEKVTMATALDFGFSLVDCGKNAIFSKFDAKDAYKNVPAPISDLRLQGFFWLGKYFFEKKQIFGASSAVANYDRLGNVLASAACIDANVPQVLLNRCLDDVTYVSPPSQPWCQNFSESYTSLSKKANVKLAENCPLNEKAFVNVQKGKVLGIWFDSKNLSWCFPLEKKVKVLDIISKVFFLSSVPLKEMQSLMGSLNNFAQLMPFLKNFKKPLNDCLAEAIEKDHCTLSPAARADLCVWSACVNDSGFWFPIPHRPSPPPLFHKVFVSDSAGLPAEKKFNGNEGVGGIGLDEEGNIIHAYQVFWSKNFVNFVDEKGARMGSKTCTLEILGILLHFICSMERMKNQHLVFKTDNMACVFGWENKYVKCDITASIIMRTIALLSASLGSEIHVVHVPRRSSWESVLVDNLSRRSTTYRSEKALLRRFSKPVLPRALRQWLDHPSEDWQLPNKILYDLNLFK
jgi:hypothetical protein